MSFSKGREMGKFEKDEVVVEEEKIYVAVSKEIKENKSLLTWALQSSGGKPVCVVHVHQPANKIPTPLGYMRTSSVRVEEVEAFRDKERNEMCVALDEYLHFAQTFGVSIEKLYIEADSIEKGIIQLIEQYDIKKLVFGAAADRHYTRRMTAVRSNKAIYVRDNSPSFCHIWFICKGYLIYTRGATTNSPKSSVGERNVVVGGGASAPPYYETCDHMHTSSPHWSADNIDASACSSTSSPMHPNTMFPTEFGKASGLESLYIEECMRRKEAETELAKVKAELEWMKRHAVEMPYKKNEEPETTELEKVKAELEYMKNNVLGELRMAVEQKALLQNQIGNATFLLQMLGEKLASAINVVHKPDDL